MQMTLTWADRIVRCYCMLVFVCVCFFLLFACSFCKRSPTKKDENIMRILWCSANRGKKESKISKIDRFHVVCGCTHKMSIIILGWCCITNVMNFSCVCRGVFHCVSFFFARKRNTFDRKYVSGLFCFSSSNSNYCNIVFIQFYWCSIFLHPKMNEILNVMRWILFFEECVQWIPSICPPVNRFIDAGQICLIYCMTISFQMVFVYKINLVFQRIVMAQRS